MEDTFNINILLPEEIEEIIILLTEKLNIVKKDKSTNSKIINKERDLIECPYYHSTNIIKNGHDKNKVQTYICKDCKKRFNACTNTLVAHRKLEYDKILIFFECMDNKLSIKKNCS